MSKSFTDTYTRTQSVCVYSFQFTCCSHISLSLPLSIHFKRYSWTQIHAKYHKPFQYCCVKSLALWWHSPWNNLRSSVLRYIPNWYFRMAHYSLCCWWLCFRRATVVAAAAKPAAAVDVHHVVRNSNWCHCHRCLYMIYSHCCVNCWPPMLSTSV